MIEIIALIILTGVIIAQYVFHYLTVKESNKEKTKLIHALISKNAEQMRDLELTEKVAPIKPMMETAPDLVEERELSDEDFEKALTREGL